MGNNFCASHVHNFHKKTASFDAKMTPPVTSSRLHRLIILSRASSQEEEEEDKGKDKETGDDDAIDYDRENILCSSPRTRALDHFRDDRLLQSARLLRKICDSLVVIIRGRRRRRRVKRYKRKRERKDGEIRVWKKRNSRSRSSRC